MIVSHPLAHSRQVVGPANITKYSWVAGRMAGRTIQIALAIYLLPALLVVLSVGCLGMALLAGGRLILGPGRELLSH